MKTSNAKPITIAVDGYSSTGKSTMARALAKRLGFRYIDTGAMYRAVTLYALREELFDAEDRVNKEALLLKLPHIKLRFTASNTISLNGAVVEEEIRSMRVSERVSKVAAITEVRRKLVAEQQAMGAEGGIVMDGRDVGTVIFPDAELKIFMTADPLVRAKRRQAELAAKGEHHSLEEVLKNLVERDELDAAREEGPLVQAEDARILDNSHLSREDQLKLAESWARAAGA
jgi:cytidylate kinase